MDGPVKNGALLHAQGITKHFAKTLALNDVSLDVYPGRVNVLLGENGAGKSTLVKIISGVYQKDAGEIWFEGEKVEYGDVHAAQKLGISIIHQELNLLPERTIAQNIFLGREPLMACGIIDSKKMNADSKEILNSLGLDLKPNTLVKSLSIAQQQMVEVAKALSFDLKLLIFDEPTSSLTSKEIDKLFAIVDDLKRKGIAIIYISHRMDEIRRVGDEITILRDGCFVDCVDAKTSDMDDVVSKMVGRKIEDLYVRNRKKSGEVVLETVNLTGIRFRNVNIYVRRGEIVSLSGLVGAGRTEVAKAIFGFDPLLGGSYLLNGKRITRATPKGSVRRGISFLPEDRKAEGLFLKKSIKQNISAASLFKLFPQGVIHAGAETKLAEDCRQDLNIVTSGVEKLVGELSGGNQQKVLVGKWLVQGSSLYIFDEPTRGIDVGAKAEIYRLLDKLAGEGAAVLMISSELNEVVGLSDRVYIMRDGEVVKEFQQSEISPEALVAYAVGGEYSHA